MMADKLSYKKENFALLTSDRDLCEIFGSKEKRGVGILGWGGMKGLQNKTY